MAAPDEKLLRSLRGVLRGWPGLRLALLFGSRARGSARPDSDVDVAVSGDLDRLALAAELGRACGLEVQVVDLDTAPWALRQALLRDAVPLHEGERHAAARWWTRTILEVETDGPLHRRMRDAWLARVAGEHRGRS